MPKRDSELLLEDMFAAIRRVLRYTDGMDWEAFRQDEKTIDAVVRNLEILGAAGSRMTVRLRSLIEF